MFLIFKGKSIANDKMNLLLYFPIEQSLQKNAFPLPPVLQQSLGQKNYEN